jgi:hypothetical protein
VVQETEYSASPSSDNRLHSVVFPEPDGPETTSKIPLRCDMALRLNRKSEIQNPNFREDGFPRWKKGMPGHPLVPAV